MRCQAHPCSCAVLGQVQLPLTHRQCHRPALRCGASSSRRLPALRFLAISSGEGRGSKPACSTRTGSVNGHRLAQIGMKEAEARLRLSPPKTEEHAALLTLLHPGPFPQLKMHGAAEQAQGRGTAAPRTSSSSQLKYPYGHFNEICMINKYFRPPHRRGLTQQEGQGRVKDAAQRQPLAVVQAPDGRKQQQRRSIACHQQRHLPAVAAAVRCGRVRHSSHVHATHAAWGRHGSDCKRGIFEELLATL